MPPGILATGGRGRTGTFGARTKLFRPPADTRLEHFVARLRATGPHRYTAASLPVALPVSPDFRMPMPLRPLILFESPAAELALRRQGLATLDAIFAGQAAAEVRHVGRAVLKTELPCLGGATETVYIKLSWGRRRWWPRMADIRTRQVFQSLAVREWEGLKVFERLGLRVPERLALLEEGASGSARR